METCASKRFYAAAEIGLEDRDWDKDQPVVNIKWQLHKNWEAILAAYQTGWGWTMPSLLGLRYGFATFPKNWRNTRVYYQYYIFRRSSGQFQKLFRVECQLGRIYFGVKRKFTTIYFIGKRPIEAQA